MKIVYTGYNGPRVKTSDGQIVVAGEVIEVPDQAAANFLRQSAVWVRATQPEPEKKAKK